MGLYRRDYSVPFRQVPVCHYGKQGKGIYEKEGDVINITKARKGKIAER